MTRRIIRFLPLLILAGCSTSVEKRVPRAAAEAMTGSPWTLTAVSSLTIEGNGKGVDETGAPFSVTSFQRVMNFKKGAWRQQESRDGGPWHGTMLPAAERLHYPFGFILAAFASRAQLGNMRTEGNMEAVDLRVDGGVYTLFIDAKTHLPAKIASSTRGQTVETLFAKYVAVHGYQLPSEIIRNVDSSPVWELSVTRQIASADAVALASGIE